MMVKLTAPTSGEPMAMSTMLSKVTDDVILVVGLDSNGR